MHARSFRAQFALGRCSALKNFDNLFAAWMIVWVVFFVFEVSVARRMARLREEVDRLKRQLREG